VILALALGAILVRAHRITSNDVIFFCVLIPSVILHEIAHGAVALVFGDDTAKRAGRLSLNPLRHVTLFGTIIVPFVTILSGLGFFGWAKPVPVNVRRLRSPRNHGFLVALAGPLTNILLAIVIGAVFYVVFAAGHPFVVTTLPARIVFWASVVNIWVACFNLIPVPPLDGSALVERLLPASWWPGYLRIRPYGMMIILGVLVLSSFTRTSPIATVFTSITTWWAHVIHAY
jgi:Zn-dependent protease